MNTKLGLDERFPVASGESADPGGGAMDARLLMLPGVGDWFSGGNDAGKKTTSASPTKYSTSP